jgi:hypothetical protein
MPLWIFLPIALLCVALVFYRYYTINRLASGIGWSLLILAIGGFGSGLASAFAWSGFVFLLLAASGVLIVVQDEIVRRSTDQNRERRREQYPDHHR